MITARPSLVPTMAVSAAARSFQKSASLRVCTRELSEADVASCPGPAACWTGWTTLLVVLPVPPGFTTLGELDVTRVSVTP